MKFNIFTLFLFTILTTKYLFPQTPVVEWQKKLGGNNGDYPLSIEHTSDGGYITAGYTEGPDNADIVGYHGNTAINDFWVVKMDNTGNVEWKKCIGDLSVEYGGYIHQTPDGGYVLSGSSASVVCQTGANGHSMDYWIAKLSSTGDLIWQKWFGGSQNDYAFSLSLTTDGGFIVGGRTESSDGDVMINHGMMDYWIIKVDGNGNLVWQKSLGGTNEDECFSVQATNDGGCIAAGSTLSNDGDVSGNHGARDYWIVKLDNTGNLQWQKCLGGTKFEIAFSISTTNDGGYIVAGQAGSNDGDVSGNHTGIAVGFLDYWVVKLDNTGNLQWQKCYGGDKNEIAYVVRPTPDGGYLVGGSSESANGDISCNGGDVDMWVIKVNSTGISEWQKSFGGTFQDLVYAADALSDGSFIIAGITCSYELAGFHVPTTINSCPDFWIIKLSQPTLTIPSPIVGITPATINLCNGGTATLTAITLYGGGKPVYQWFKNGVPVGTNSPVYSSNAFNNNDIITCNVTTGETCPAATKTGSATITLAVTNTALNPQINITADNPNICNCNTVTFTASVVNPVRYPIYQWKVNGGNVGSNQSYFSSYSLQNGDIITCTYFDLSGCIVNGAVVSNSVQMTVGTITPQINITSSADTICEGSAVTFNALPVNAGLNPSFQWKLNGINTGSNSNLYTNSNIASGDVVTCVVTTDPQLPCVSSNTANSNAIKIIVKPKVNPSVNIATPTQNICIGTNAQFTANAINAGNSPAYQWQLNGTNTGMNSPTYSNASLAEGDVVSCMITADPVFTCINTTTAISNNILMHVTNGLQPQLAVAASANDVCSGTSITFNATAQNAGSNPSYEWYINTQIVGSGSVYNSNTLRNGDQVYCILTPGNNSCSSSPVSSNITSMKINSLPVITIQPADTLIPPGVSIQLIANSSEPLAAFNWIPANKLQSPLSLSSQTVPLIDNITYTLSGVDMKGCSGYGEAVIKVFVPLLMPTAFTPNNDGLNDLFRIPQNTSLSLDEFSIYDRWGNKVFSTHDISKGWDGSYKGAKSPTGVYVYLVKGSDAKGGVFLKGIVSLIR